MMQRIANGIARTALSLVAGALLSTLPDGAALARGVSPYLPLNLSPEVERNIERVLILADKPVMTRPIAAATVLDALPKACKADPVLCERVRRYLSTYMHSFVITHGSAEGALTKDVTKSIPNRRGLATDSPWQVAAGAFFQPSSYALLSLGGIAYDGDTQPTGSLLSAGFEYAQLDVGWRDHWLSPMTDSSMLISSNAPSMASVTLSNYTPITGWGIHYEAFLAEMSRADHIQTSDGPTSGHPRLAGLHASIEPVSGWSLGVNRLMQYGGGERGGQSLGDVFDAFFRPSRFDNQDANLDVDAEFGNQLASFTSSFLFPGPTPFAVYFEYAGEDTSKSDSTRLGNAALSLGVHFPRLWRGVDLTYEVSDWQNAWYVNGIYLDGLRNSGRALGHWGGDARLPDDGVGGQSHMLRVGFEPQTGGLLEVRYRTLANETYSTVDYQRAHELTLGYSRPWQALFVGTELDIGRDVFGDDFGRLSAFVRFADTGARTLSAGIPEPSTNDAPADLFVDAGINAARVRKDILNSTEVVTSGVAFTAHLGIGVRRGVSHRNDLGARLELDEFDGEPFLAVRALDYRYRFPGDSFALTAFLGAARYDLGTAAYGYYAGVGGQWRDLIRGWDLCADLRYGDKLARDRLLPGEPQGQRPDSFFDILSATLYLSRRL